MKLVMSFALAVLTTGLLAPLAVGQEDAAEKAETQAEADRPDREAMRKRFIEEHDKDGDGQLSQEERESAGETMRKRFLEEFDKDGDGKLSEEERTKGRETMRERFGDRGQRAAREAQAEAKSAEAKEKADAKAKDEKKAAKKDEKDPGKEKAADRGPRNAGRRPAPEAMRERIVKEFDKDGDGKLNDEEAMAARKAMQQRRGGRGVRPEGAPEAGERGPRDRGPREGARRDEARRGEGQRPGPAGDRGPRGDRAGGPRGAQGAPHLNRVFNHFDKDGDGKLSRAEFTTLTEIMQAMRGAGGPEVRGPAMQRGPRERGGFGPGRGGRGQGQRRGDSPGDKPEKSKEDKST